MFNYETPAMNKLVASDTTNYYTPNENQVGQGITLNSDLVSNVANSLWYKTSASIKYLQEFGGQLWMPEKQYQVGSIVWVNCVVNGNNTLIPLKCTANSTGKTYCIENPILDTLTKQDSGYCFFNGNRINTTYWNSVLIDTNVEQKLSVRAKAGTSTNNSDFTFIKLIDFNQINGWAEGDFVLKLANGPDRMMATVHVHSYGNTGIELIIKDVMYAVDYTDPNVVLKIDSFGSNFKDVGYLGCVLSIDADKCLYLNFQKSGTLSNTLDISLELSSGNIPLSLFETTKSNQWYGNRANVIVPFIQGASNRFTGCGTIFYSFYPMDQEWVYKGGLLKICNENSSPNTFLYPSISKVSYSSTIPDINDKYLVVDEHASTSNGYYIEAGLPRIYGQMRYFYNPNERRNHFIMSDRACIPEGTPAGNTQPYKPDLPGINNPTYAKGYEGCLGVTAWTSDGLYKIFEGVNYPTASGQFIIPSLTRPSQPFAMPVLEFDASKSNAIYGKSGTVRPNSRLVYAYLKVW